ncbi:vacuolar protein sorting 37A isoform X2 [Rhynchophorus ferrugineus]|uniref:vacuolar protein sorting 37A isoform X2 n=1 Tax=Rhynchophorus ferrugineus TaxID=354439 RepID=UPI003FCE5729
MLPMFYKKDTDIRKQQINTLKIFNENVREVVADSEYEIPFQSGVNRLTMKISLGQDFPKEKPILAINPKIYHPWVNEKGFVIAAPGLVNFTVHSDLGRVVQAIIRELQRNPPPLAKNNNIVISNISVLVFSSYSHQRAPNSLIAELNTLSLEELQFLNGNEDRLLEFIDEQDCIKEQQDLFDDLMHHIEELSENNLSKEQKLHQLQESVDSRLEDVSTLTFNNEKLYNVYQNLSQKYSPRNIQEELRKSAKQAEEDSDKIVDSFLQGDLDVDSFLNIFIRTKALCQLRKTKEEKLCQQLDHLEKAGF